MPAPVSCYINSPQDNYKLHSDLFRHPKSNPPSPPPPKKKKKKKPEKITTEGNSGKEECKGRLILLIMKYRKSSIKSPVWLIYLKHV